jgi:hypothetical protein
MKVYSTVLMSLFCFASPAMASFARSTCSNADGTVRYEFSMAWNQPAVTKWTIKNTVMFVDEALVQHSDRQVIELIDHSPMAQSTTTVEKVALKKDLVSDEIVFSTWWICQSAAGI